MKAKYSEKANNKAMLLAFLFFIILSFIVNKVFCQQTEWNYWANLDISKSINKKWSLYFVPEVRFTNEFKVDEYYFEPGLEYQPINFLEIGANYRFLINERETKSTQYFGRVALYIKGNYEINKFAFQLKTKYCNYSDFDTDDDNSSDPYLRYSLKVKYDIPKSKLTPSVAMELFHQLSDNEIDKTRATFALDYKINKSQKVGLSYILQDYIKKDEKKNIISLEYKISF